jgi:protein-tyrosine phosphatase
MSTQTVAKTHRVLFLCTGNYYRSRYAEIYFNWHAQERGLAWTADSRGLALDNYNVGAISRHTLASLKSRGIVSDTCARFPLPVTETDLACADHIVAVKEAEHRPLFEAKFPQWSHRVEFWHVHDLDCATPEIALPELERHVERLLSHLGGR